MPYIVPTFSEIRERQLRDIKNLLPDAAIGDDSDWFVRASAVASCAEGLYAHQAWIVRQIFPDTADADMLERHAAVRGLSLKRATAASGTMRVAGTVGTPVAVGMVAVAENGQRYVVSAAGEITASGHVDLPASAEAAGSAGNAAAGTAVQLQGARPQLDTAATLLSMQGGTERETHQELLARLLDLIRRPPAGGNRHDYRRWAMEVPGVTNAFCYPLRRGLGTVDVAVVSGNGLPSAEILTAVRDYIDAVRPVTAKDVVVFAPVQRVVNIRLSVRLSGVLLPEIEPSIQLALTEHIAGLAPGEAWVRSRAEALVSNLPGVVDRVITAPAANVQPVVDASTVEWLRAGAIAVQDMGA